MAIIRTTRAGSAIEDYCRACKVDRMHTVIAADQAGQPLRVQCGYCRSEHNYRGGPRAESSESSEVQSRQSPSAASLSRPGSTSATFPIVSESERAGPVMSSDSTSSIAELEMLLRRVIREEAGISPVVPAAKWRGGTLVLRPGTPGLQEKVIPIETFFHKIVMLRNRLRTLEQQVNASDLADDVKVRLQAYVSGCYGSLTTFNVLFAEEADQFKGAGGD